MGEVVMLNEKLVLPLLATLGASLTVLFIQFNTRRVKETKQKVYAVSYIIHQCYKILFSELSILKATVIPHIKAIERILDGDEDLLSTMFLADEFDILKAPSPKLTHLPDEYLLLVGYDDIHLASMYETLIYLESDNTCRLDLNDFVRKDLKNRNAFLSLDSKTKIDILHEYYDHLTTIEHVTNRKIFFIVYSILPKFFNYIKTYRFWLYSKKSIKNEKSCIKQVLSNYKDFVPKANFGEQSMDGGIQKEIT